MPVTTPELTHRLTRSVRPLILDGGLGTHLKARGNDLSGAGWSARILAEKPGEVEAAHRDFLDAGAEVVTTASYQLTHDVYGPATDALLRESVTVARRAAQGAGPGNLVFASAGPYGAGPGVGTEYDGAYGLTAKELAAWHRRRLAVLSEAGADAVLVETVPSLPEIEGLVDAATGLGAPLILSVTVGDGRLRDGTPLALAADAAVGIPGLVAVGVNCSSVADTVTAVHALRSTGLPVIAYPNSGEGWDPVGKRWTGSCSTTPVAAARELVGAGARGVGGCCRVGPAQIRAVTRSI